MNVSDENGQLGTCILLFWLALERFVITDYWIHGDWTPQRNRKRTKRLLTLMIFSNAICKKWLVTQTIADWTLSVYLSTVLSERLYTRLCTQIHSSILIYTTNVHVNWWFRSSTVRAMPRSFMRRNTNGNVDGCLCVAILEYWIGISQRCKKKSSVRRLLLIKQSQRANRS